MNDMLRRLRVIETQCGGKNKKAGQDMAKYDEFTRMKKDIALELKEIRVEIKRRNDMKAAQAPRPEIVQASSKIRSRIRQAQEKASALKQVQQRDASGKKKMTDDEIEESKKRGEAVELIFAHIQEISELNDETNAPSGTPGLRPAVLAPPSLYGGSGMPAPSYRNPVETELPPIEVQQGLQQLEETNREIDQEMVEISAGVSVLKDMAVEIGREVDLQNKMVDEITTEVEQVDDHLKNLNKKLKKTLSKVRTGDKLIMDMILLCIFLALMGYIYTQLS